MKVVQLKIDTYEMLSHVVREFLKKNVVFVLEKFGFSQTVQLPTLVGDSLLSYYKWVQQTKIKDHFAKGQPVNCTVFYSGAVPPIVRKIEALQIADYFCAGECHLSFSGKNAELLPIRHGEVAFDIPGSGTK